MEIEAICLLRVLNYGEHLKYELLTQILLFFKIRIDQIQFPELKTYPWKCDIIKTFLKWFWLCRSIFNLYSNVKCNDLNA